MFLVLNLWVCLFVIPAGPGWTTEATVTVGGPLWSKVTIDQRLFGAFYEEHWGDITPGIYEQALVNPSFEAWYTRPDGKENKTRLLFAVEPSQGVAFPWEPVRTDPARPEPTGPVSFRLSTESFNSDLCQAIEVDNTLGGVRQRVALPDYRVTTYRLRFFARVEGALKVTVALRRDQFHRPVIEQQEVAGLGEKWQLVDLVLDTRGPLPTRYLSHFGVADIAITAEGTGTLYLDQATLLPTDCVEGVYNPETLANVATFGPTLIRWPGGNYTSGYHWRDGIGPVETRTVRPNFAWGGLEDNHVGTDEWLRFCELAGLECVMGCGFSEEISPRELAEWVEYCNGPASTPMGALRAANGHPEPYGVHFWGIGNETYGSYQLGHTDAETYARGFLVRAAAMKAADPSIEVAAVGYGCHNDYRHRDNDWNETVLAVAGHAIDLLDIHYYIHGPAQPVVDSVGSDPVLAAFLASDHRLDQYLWNIADLLDTRPETRDIKVALYEWGILPRAGQGTPRRQSFANALVTALHYHTFFRHPDLLQQAALHNFSYFINPVPSHSEPPNPRSHISRLYASLARGQLVETRVSSPTYEVSQDFTDIGAWERINCLDAVAVQDPSGNLHLCLVNRSLDQNLEVEVQLPGLPPGQLVVSQSLTSEDPLARLTWSTTMDVFTRTKTNTVTTGSGHPVDMPPLSVQHLVFQLDSNANRTAPSAP